jgi:peptidyl-prolyl cis-trans isomerase B (cyclophilin B)
MKVKISILLAFVFFFSLGKVTAQTKEKMVLIETSKGNIKIKLYNETPLHRDNFLKLVKEKYYDGVLFHRVIKKFMIQAGDPDSKTAKPDQILGNGGPDYTIAAEFNPNLFHKKGVLAAARLGDQANPEKRSSGSQFYIVQGEVFDDAKIEMVEKRLGKKLTDKQKQIYKTIGGTPHLDGAYTVFGEVVSGLEVIDTIAAVKTGKADRPVEDIKIISMKIVK